MCVTWKELSEFNHNQVYFGQFKHRHTHRATGTKGVAKVKYLGLRMRQYFKSTFSVLQFWLCHLRLISFTEAQC